MTLFSNLLIASLALTASISAASVSPLDARHDHHARAVRAAAAAAVAEPELEARNTSGDLEARSSGKIGLAWTGQSNSNLKHFKTSSVKYMHTWSTWCPEQAPSLGIECCPMLWGDKMIGDFQKHKYSGGKCIMGMNEVNVKGQSNMSPSHGVKLWNSYIRDMNKQGYYLITPSVTSGNDGIQWLKDFFGGCGGKAQHCNASAVAMHYYGTSVNDFISWTKKFHQFGLDVWVTEIACQNFGDPKNGQCSKDQVVSFLEGVTSYMNSTPWIKSYMWFGLFADMYNVNPDNRLVDSKSLLPNSLGHKYLSG